MRQRGRIADFKAPRHLLIVDEIPKGPTGKVRRVGLAAALGLGSHDSTLQAFVAPRTSLEKALAERWADALQVERVGIHDDFFALGGDSLRVAHVVADVFEMTHLEIDASQFFEAPTVAETARHIEEMIRAGGARRASSSIPRMPRGNAIPASIAQERLWKLQRLLPGMPFLNVFCPLRLASPCDGSVLQRSLDEIVRRHEILRTTFAIVEDRCVQVIAPQLTVPLVSDDLHALPQAKKKTIGHRLIQEEALHSFDLGQGPLFRVRLVRLAEAEHLLLITMHGSIVDGWSVGVFAEELFSVYDAFAAGGPSPLAPLAIQYADFAQWQRRWQAHPEVVAQLAYWREQLRGPLPEMKLSTGSAKQAVDHFRTARQEVTLPAGLTEAARTFSRREGGTLYMALVAALQALLQRYLSQDDVRVATLVANRNRPEIKRLIGPLANMVILRTNLSGDSTLQEVMRRVRATTLAAFAHQDLPFEELAATLEREGDLTHAALSPVMITLHNAALRPIGSDRHKVSFEEAEPNMVGPLMTPTRFDVSMMLRESTEGIIGYCVYKPYLFNADTIDRLVRDFREVLHLMVMRPARRISSIDVSFQRNRRNFVSDPYFNDQNINMTRREMNP
jgi:acyl carrier protein